MTFDELLENLDGWAGEAVAVWWLDVETQRVFGRAEGPLGRGEQMAWASIDGPGGDAVGFRIGAAASLTLYRNAFSAARWWQESLCIEFGPVLVAAERRAQTSAEDASSRPTPVR